MDLTTLPEPEEREGPDEADRAALAAAATLIGQLVTALREPAHDVTRPVRGGLAPVRTT
ncbi:hypothetical protein [Streptomyces sp. WM6386]|uniref:hypothetical protein n=1 Tax=Streptomyces sp. WM6386 TaxID=1415558 RepID=UPI00131BB9EC|nr:hypothetical protein [Streptomyces sp. WM6386]